MAITQADQFYKENKFVEVYEVLVKEKSDLSNCELQWKLARAARDLSQLDSTSKEKKKDLIYEGLQCAENAVKADESNFAAHKVSNLHLFLLLGNETLTICFLTAIEHQFLNIPSYIYKDLKLS